MKKVRVSMFLAVLLTSDFIFGMIGVTQCEIPVLIGWIISAYILFKYGRDLFEKPLYTAVIIALILNIIISIIFSFLNITYSGPLQINYINELYGELFGKAIVQQEYKWADNLFNGLIILEYIVQLLFRILICAALLQINKKTDSNKKVCFVKVLTIAYIPLYTLAKSYFLIEVYNNSICEKSNWSSDFAQWWIYSRSDIMTYLYLIATVIFWILVFVTIKSGNLKKHIN